MSITEKLSSRKNVHFKSVEKEETDPTNTDQLVCQSSLQSNYQIKTSVSPVVLPCSKEFSIGNAVDKKKQCQKYKNCGAYETYENTYDDGKISVMPVMQQKHIKETILPTKEGEYQLSKTKKKICESVITTRINGEKVSVLPRKEFIQSNILIMSQGEQMQQLQDCNSNELQGEGNSAVFQPCEKSAFSYNCLSDIPAEYKHFEDSFGKGHCNSGGDVGLFSIYKEKHNDVSFSQFKEKSSSAFSGSIRFAAKKTNLTTSKVDSIDHSSTERHIPDQIWGELTSGIGSREHFYGGGKEAGDSVPCDEFVDKNDESSEKSHTNAITESYCRPNQLVEHGRFVAPGSSNTDSKDSRYGIGSILDKTSSLIIPLQPCDSKCKATISPTEGVRIKARLSHIKQTSSAQKKEKRLLSLNKTSALEGETRCNGCVRKIKIRKPCKRKIQISTTADRDHPEKGKMRRSRKIENNQSLINSAEKLDKEMRQQTGKMKEAPDRPRKYKSENLRASYAVFDTNNENQKVARPRKRKLAFCSGDRWPSGEPTSKKKRTTIEEEILHSLSKFKDSTPSQKTVSFDVGGDVMSSPLKMKKISKSDMDVFKNKDAWRHHVKYGMKKISLSKTLKPNYARKCDTSPSKKCVWPSSKAVFTAQPEMKCGTSNTKFRDCKASPQVGEHGNCKSQKQPFKTIVMKSQVIPSPTTERSPTQNEKLKYSSSIGSVKKREKSDSLVTHKRGRLYKNSYPVKQKWLHKTSCLHSESSASGISTKPMRRPWHRDIARLRATKSILKTNAQQEPKGLEPINFRSFNKGRRLGSTFKVKVTNLDNVTSTTLKKGTSPEVHTKTCDKKMKMKPPPESQPLNHTLPFLKLDRDDTDLDLESMITEEGSELIKSELALPQDNRKQRARTPPLPKVEHKNTPLTLLCYKYLHGVNCDLHHHCCRKNAVAKSDQATQWEDPSEQYVTTDCAFPQFALPRDLLSHCLESLHWNSCNLQSNHVFQNMQLFHNIQPAGSLPFRKTCTEMNKIPIFPNTTLKFSTEPSTASETNNVDLINGTFPSTSYSVGPELDYQSTQSFNFDSTIPLKSMSVNPEVYISSSFHQSDNEVDSEVIISGSQEQNLLLSNCKSGCNYELSPWNSGKNSILVDDDVQ